MGIADRLKTDRRDKRFTSSHIAAGWLLALVLLITAYLLINSSYFIIGEIIITGNKYVTQDEIYRIAGIPSNLNIFRLDTLEIKKKLTKDLRINEVDVRRKLPTTILITINERQPLAYVANMYGFVQLDRQGVVISAFKNIKQMNIPFITGVKLGNVYVGDRSDDIKLKNMLLYLASLNEATVNQISEINVSSTNELTAYTINSVQVRLGKAERLTEKARITCDILREVQQKKISVEYIDLNYASPYIKVNQ